MPLINFVGQVSTRKNFYLALCFVSNEQESSYSWTLQTLQKQLLQERIQAPRVIFSDDADSLLNACGQVFKESISLLCLWHIMKNIETRVRPLISKQLLLQDLPNQEVQMKTITLWRNAKAKFMQIVLETTKEGMEARKASFLEHLSDPIY
jgi:transposase-like protein